MFNILNNLIRLITGQIYIKNIAPIIPIALAVGSAVANKKAQEKQNKAEKQRNEAIEKENRKNAIARALGVGNTGTARRLPTGVADNTLLNTLGGLASVGSNLTSRSIMNTPQAAQGPQQTPIAQSGFGQGRGTADNSSILRRLNTPRPNAGGSFPIRNTNIG